MNTLGLKFILAERFTFDPNSNSLLDEHNPDEIQYLGGNESRILQFLVQNPNKVVKRNELHDFVWRQQGFEVDDSSLTQAISTLRKNLDDSTKSPQFIKTVPKQGYQWIAAVASANIMNGKKQSASPKAEQSYNNPIEEGVEKHSELNVELDSLQKQLDATEVPLPFEAEVSSETPSHINQGKSLRLVHFIWLLALLIPFIIVFFLDAPQTPFKSLFSVDDVEVVTPLINPNLNQWQPTIEQCVYRYNEVHATDPKPIQVIATGGQENRLVLNYIYNQENTEKNTTLILLTNQQELSKVCR